MIATEYPVPLFLPVARWDRTKHCIYFNTVACDAEFSSTSKNLFTIAFNSVGFTPQKFVITVIY